MAEPILEQALHEFEVTAGSFAVGSSESRRSVSPTSSRFNR
jgi:hypothetical protein